MQVDICQTQGISDARLAMYGRILRCPMGSNPAFCPLHDIRLLPVEERIQWLESKSDEEVDELFLYHQRCVRHQTLLASL
ncbi:MAG: hypothetical protein PHP93_00945 [Kiritimatiellales bacterium]|nr:hypothetical protein [Kiritimatiellales bacterium]